MEPRLERLQDVAVERKTRMELGATTERSTRGNGDAMVENWLETTMMPFESNADSCEE